MSNHTPELVCAARVCYSSACKLEPMNARRAPGPAKSEAVHGVWRVTGAALPSGENAIPTKHESIAEHGSADFVANVPKSTTADGDLSAAKTECGKRGNVAWTGLPKVTLQPINSAKSENGTKVAASTATNQSEPFDLTPKTQEDLTMCAQEQEEANTPRRTSSHVAQSATPKNLASPTPGPWKRSERSWDGESFWVIEDQTGAVICQAETSFHCYPSGSFITVADEIAANIKLLEAAPDLLAACKKAVTMHYSARRDADDAWLTPEVREMMNAAIAEAEGETT